MSNQVSKNQAIMDIITPNSVRGRKEPQKIIKLKEALKFAKHNGYILAVYYKKDNNYLLKDDAYMSDIYEDTDIMVKTIGAAIDFNEFTTADGEYCFRLHNNFNVPKIIPIISRG